MAGRAGFERLAPARRRNNRTRSRGVRADIVTDVSVVSWTRAERHLPSDEVDGAFDTARDRLLVFAFETRRMRVDPHAGSFSVKLVTRGRERYDIDGTAVTLDPGALLLVNAGERYASRVDDAPTAALSCFLPDAQARTLPKVVPLPFRPPPLVAGIARRLVATCGAATTSRDPAAIAGLVDELVAAAVPASLARFRPEALAHVVQRRTRRDLLARAARARDLIEDQHGVGITLARMADLACLSPFHLLRVFAAAFGVTPSVYARRCRLSRARRLLGRRMDVRSVARLTGYGSVSTLGRALRAHGVGGSSETGGSGSERSRTSV
jgi:AraC-like DNA-binding protein